MACLYFLDFKIGYCIVPAISAGLFYVKLFFNYMIIRCLLFFLMFSSVVVGQEIGSVKQGNHYIKLLKANNLYSFVYSDIKSKNQNSEKAFHFHNKETVYSILMNGFDAKKNRQIIVKTSNDTIVKFNFKKIKGELMLFVYQNNLNSNTFGTSTFFSKKQITKLFGNI